MPDIEDVIIASPEAYAVFKQHLEARARSGEAWAVMTLIAERAAAAMFAYSRAR